MRCLFIKQHVYKSNHSPTYSNTWSLVNFLKSHVMKNKAAKEGQRNKKDIRHKKQKSKRADINPTTSIVTSNVND